TSGVQMDIPSLPNGGALVFSVTAQLTSGATGIVQNSMTASFAEEINPTGASFAVTATALSTAALAVNGTPPTGPVLGGSAASFTMVVTNNGPGTAQALNISNSLSAGITPAGAITCTAAHGATCPATLGPTV